MFFVRVALYIQLIQEGINKCKIFILIKKYRHELDLLEDDATVYKLIGPVLVKQNLIEAKQNVEKRIDYITTEMRKEKGLFCTFHMPCRKRLEELMADAATKQENQKQIVMRLQNAGRIMLRCNGYANLACPNRSGYSWADVSY
ncbi:unnamed protein product [Onchocerca flexuosa]|uniref:Prefoldin subunit n=1 Tax=Onchocerca flexuosa TaxID=387005 RepID=A0A183HAY8_9BILA|nr:unnamed protein product [Onchocerca flexuosa]